jgi:hypothetical protein
MQRSFKTQGFSLIELLLVLGVLAVLLVAAFVVYPAVRDRNQANSMASHVTAIQASVRNTFASKARYQGLDTTTANKARAFPVAMNGGDYTVGHSGIQSPWGGLVYVDGVNAITATPTGNIPVYRSFYIRLASVPDGVCLPLISAVSGQFRSVLVGGVEVMTASGMDPGVAAAQCKNNPDVAFYST